MKARVQTGAAALVLALVASSAAARADNDPSVPGVVSDDDHAAVLAGAVFRNGDWFAVDAFGMVVFSPAGTGRCIAATARGELGIGGAAAAIGLATNVVESSCTIDRDFLESGIVSLEARFERMYGPTSWRKTEYAGAQVSLATFWWWRPSLTWMYNVHDATDKHVQFGLGVLF
jgi:hypothetical protein